MQPYWSRQSRPGQGRVAVRPGCWLGLVLITLAACADASPPQREVEDVAATAAEPAAAEAETAEAADDRMRRAMQTSARAALDLLLQWDTAGLRHAPAEDAALSALYCFLPEQGCLSEEPGWDHAIAVRGYMVEPRYETPDSATFEVVFDEIGVVWPDGMEEAQTIEPQVLRFMWMAGAWRLVEATPDLQPHLSVDAIARRYRGIHPDSGVIVRWLRDRE